MRMQNRIIHKRIHSFWGIQLRLTDTIIIGSLVLYTILNLIYRLRLEEWAKNIISNLVILGGYLACVYFYQHSKKRILRFLIRTASVQVLFLYLFSAVHDYQLLFSYWKDPQVIVLEETIFGIIPNLFLQQYAVPLLTEIMMFAYVLYIPLYPVLAALIFFKFGEDHFEYYLLLLAGINTLCNLGFIVYPVASPYWWEPLKESYQLPMRGYLFTRVGEFIRTHMHQAGGSLPSPHCAIATVMWYFSYQVGRRLFYILTPFIIMIYVSTVFCGYHYTTDAVIGIMAGLLMILVSRPYFQRMQKQNVPKG